MQSITLSLGQPVPWKPAADQIAQVCELRRRKVMLVYPCKNGLMRFPVVKPQRIAEALSTNPLIPMHNPFNRAIRRPKEKVYALPIADVWAEPDGSTKSDTDPAPAILSSDLSETTAEKSGSTSR